RDDFQSMIEGCLSGKIDMVITKSISRFARNTVDALTNIRKLKEKGIPVLFETEGINTLSESGELLLTILSSQAQEESRNTSENCRWGIVRRFEAGKVMVNQSKFMGYTKDEEGNLIIVPEEAEIVKKIFRLYLEGNSSYRIAKILEEEKIKTVTGRSEWQATVINQMLANEKYMGDVLLQKTYTVDYLTHKKVVNKGIVPQYYIENDHEPIIPKQLFYRVQEERARRAGIYHAKMNGKKGQERGKYSSKYALSGILFCGECGQPYRRQVWSRYERKYAVWRCSNRLENGTKYCKHSPTLKEEGLHEGIMEAIGKVVADQGNFVQAFRQNVIRVIGNYRADFSPTEYDGRIDELQSRMLQLIEDNAKTKCTDEEFDRAYREIADELKELRQKKMQTQKEQEMAKAYDRRVGEMDTYLRNSRRLSREYDDDLVRRLLQTLKVVDENTLEIQFRSGIVMKQRLGMWGE
ncbi:MAG: recombinase family protein, partial [Eubacteriales bacterium]|nr:recombinase family protein [Eubacteriales bacterium]